MDDLAAWQAERERRNEYARQYYAKLTPEDKAKRNERTRTLWAQATPNEKARRLKYNREYAAARGEKYREYQRAWRAKNQEKCRAWKKAYQAKGKAISLAGLAVDRPPQVMSIEQRAAKQLRDGRAYRKKMDARVDCGEQYDPNITPEEIASRTFLMRLAKRAWIAAGNVEDMPAHLVYSIALDY